MLGATLLDRMTTNQPSAQSFLLLEAIDDLHEDESDAKAWKIAGDGPALLKLFVRFRELKCSSWKRSHRAFPQDTE